MEIDIDDVPWKDDLVTVPPKIENGALVVPDGPGWGTELNEEAIAAHPPKR
jgi:L-alanine-DL-glutamate epimerase-like enolase superfamily enzyme